MVGWIVALISGVLMSIQGVLNTEVTKQTSLWVSTGWVQLSALIVCITAWLIRDRSSVTALMDVSPKYMLLGGVIGAFITLTVIVSMDQLGPVRQGRAADAAFDAVSAGGGTGVYGAGEVLPLTIGV